MVSSENTPLKQTNLYSKHLKLNARMVDFAGYAMPLNYESQIVEHTAVRADAGIFDVSHMKVVDLKGARVFEMMSYLIANDVSKIKKNQAIYSAMLNHNGGIIDDLITYFVDDNYYRLVVNAGCAEKDIQWIKSVAKEFKVEVDTSQKKSIIALQGPKAKAYLMDFLNDFEPHLIDEVESLKPFYFYFSDKLMIAKTGYTGESGVECILDYDLAEKFWDMMIEYGVTPCGLASRDSLRLEAGFPLYGKDLDENHNPFESGLAWCTSLNTDREFIGKKALLDIKNKGIKNKLAGVVLKERGMIRDGQVVLTSNGKGLVTSGGYSPVLKHSIALVRIPIKCNEDCQIQVRDKTLDAKIVPPSFIKNGKALVEIDAN